MTDTRFLILARLQQTQPNKMHHWAEVATVNARSKEQALRSVGGNAGVYVAVPVRSWQPVRLEIETVQKTRLSAATTKTEVNP